ncbi:hypothetical protein C3B79_0984 [Aeromonas hydrophila]|nr:hypothetical protein C3B79_0984 [Aeromonas hydrophila]
MARPVARLFDDDVGTHFFGSTDETALNGRIPSGLRCTDKHDNGARGNKRLQCLICRLGNL